MSTTTIRLEEQLKARIAQAAARAGKSPHAFILDALADTVEHDEIDAEMHRIAEERWAKVQRTGATVPWSEAKAYIQARAAGQKAARPSARKTPR